MIKTISRRYWDSQKYRSKYRLWVVYIFVIQVHKTHSNTQSIFGEREKCSKRNLIFLIIKKDNVSLFLEQISPCKSVVEGDSTMRRHIERKRFHKWCCQLKRFHAKYTTCDIETVRFDISRGGKENELYFPINIPC